MRLIALAVLSLPLAAQAAPSLSIDGECPGLSTIEITGLTPGGNMTMLFSAGLGEGAIPAGGCGGTITGLDPVRWAMTMPDVDEDGRMRFSPFMPESACGMHVQIMDPTDCSLSGIATIGDAAVADILYVADGRSAPGNLYEVDLTSGAVTIVGALSNSYTGLTFDDSGNLYGTTGCYSDEIYRIDTSSGAESYVGVDIEGCEGSIGFDGSYLVTFEEDGCWSRVSTDGSPIDSGCGVADTYYGQGLSRDAAGTLWALGATDYYSWDGSDFAVFEASFDAGLTDSGDGGGATWHNGRVIRIENGVLYAIDPLAGTVDDLGIFVSEQADAITSATP